MDRKQTENGLKIYWTTTKRHKPRPTTENDLKMDLKLQKKGPKMESN